MKNPNDPIGNRIRDITAGSVVPQPTAPPRIPNHMLRTKKVLLRTNIYLRILRGGQDHHRRRLVKVNNLLSVIQEVSQANKLLSAHIKGHDVQNVVREAYVP
jgi:hypothetical protein